MRKDFRERLGKERLYCDGATGTILQGKGLKGGELPETWNLTRPDEVLDMNYSYFAVGSDIVYTNTFGANALKYPDNLKEIVEAGVDIAIRARAKAGREEDAYVALDIGPTGKLLAPMGDLPFERAVELFAETIRYGAQAGADLVLIETMSDSLEAKAAVLAAKENCDLPVLITLVFDGSGKLLTGGTVETVVPMLEGLHVDAVGINCGFGPDQMIEATKKLAEIATVPLIVNPNAGLPRDDHGKLVYDLTPEAFAEDMCAIADLGVHVLGGCCGTTPEHIKAEIAATRNRGTLLPKRERTRTVVTSFAQAVEIGKRPVIIGERINPTGKKKFQQALRDHQIEYILQQGTEQEEAGADILDVNVGIPDIDEPVLLDEVLQALQGMTALPLQIDTSDFTAMERALRHYNGKPMINSVNGKQEIMDAVFPLVQKYGGVLVALCLDEDGIPKTAEGRIRVAKKIYAEADKYGIPHCDIVIDALAMTISAEPESALATLETLRRVRDELHGHTILGVSNISFGLPLREIINSHFLTMAMQNGLSCAIMNPNNEAMMQSYHAFNALMALDENCSEYIGAYAQKAAELKAAKAQVKESDRKEPGAESDLASGTVKTGQSDRAGNGQKQEMTLAESVEKGLKKRSADATAQLLQQMDGLEIIDRELIPALDRVGKGFEKGTLFLPQLLMSAEAAKAAFQVIKSSMSAAENASKGKVILATVKGDIHDIGKNIVKVMLENYSYEVIDLGKDVAPETIVECAIREDISLVGLSALMTTTVVSMEETIKLLREKKPETKVVVGGAVMTQEYADQIGADCYAKDAMETVRYADHFYERAG